MNESNIFGVSVRGWLAVLTVLTLCIMAYVGKKVDEPFYTIVISIVSFYFGQKTHENNSVEKPDVPSGTV
jgi:hypothetical protein